MTLQDDEYNMMLGYEACEDLHVLSDGLQVVGAMSPERDMTQSQVLQCSCPVPLFYWLPHCGYSPKEREKRLEMMNVDKSLKGFQWKSMEINHKEPMDIDDMISKMIFRCDSEL